MADAFPVAMYACNYLTRRSDALSGMHVETSVLDRQQFSARGPADLVAN